MPKTRRKLQRKKSRKKRGGGLMFTSTHKKQMDKLQTEIDNRDDQIQKLLSETVKLINSKETEKALKVNEHSINMKAKLLKGVNAVKQQLKDEKAEDFKNALIGDLKEKEGELKEVENNLTNCEGLSNELQEQIKNLEVQAEEDDELYDQVIRELKEKKREYRQLDNSYDRLEEKKEEL